MKDDKKTIDDRLKETKKDLGGSKERSPRSQGSQRSYYAAPQKKNLVTPDQHYDDMKKLYLFGFTIAEITEEKDNERKEREVHALIDQNGNIYVSGTEKFTANEWEFSSPPEVLSSAYNRISNEALRSMIEGEQVSPYCPAEAFSRTVDILEELVYYKDERIHEFIALWTIGTYGFRLFETYPYLLLSGPKRSAKTRTQKILSFLAFNAEHSPNLSPASLFRGIQSKGTTLLLDEMEQISNKEDMADLRSMLLSGYKAGGVVPRVEKGANGYYRALYSVYSPKSIANIKGLDDVLGDRGVLIHTVRVGGKAIPQALKKITNRIVNVKSRREEYLKLRDSYYHMFWDYHTSLIEIRDRVQADDMAYEQILARNAELWRPILILAEWIDGFEGVSGTKDRMLELAQDIVGRELEEEQDSNEHQIIRALHERSERNECGERCWVQYTEVRETWAKNLGKETIPDWMTGRFLGKKLRHLGFETGKTLRRMGQGWEVQLIEDDIQQMIDFWGVDTFPVEKTELEKLVDKIQTEKEEQDIIHSDLMAFAGLMDNWEDIILDQDMIKAWGEDKMYDRRAKLEEDEYIENRDKPGHWQLTDKGKRTLRKLGGAE